ncbi:carbohydrate kinase family protein [Micromonospora sp. DT81.3]|uniref:carbohydrate kinase family protein n=1 Tax=Micromonospora sp. DT81.3 TaxID=3416523 RepID=UPI003CE7D42E
MSFERKDERTPGDPDARVVVVGEALVDIVHRADGSVDEAPGGSPANVALTLGRLGRAPRLVTRLADDAHGRAVRAWLERSGVTVEAVDAPRTATATAHLDATGAATYEFDIDWALDGAPIPVADVLHVGSVAALLQPGADDVSRLVDELRGSATITYDPNIRPSLLPDAAAARTRVESLVARADVVKASDEDLRWLHPGEDPVAAATRWQRSGPAVVVVTTGGDGAFAVTGAGAVRVPAVPTSVIDTVGAGDTFMGALIDGVIEAGLSGAGRRADLRDIDHSVLEAVLRRCATAAGITVSRPGADPPWRSDLTSHLSPRSAPTASAKG